MTAVDERLLLAAAQMLDRLDAQRMREDSLFTQGFKLGYAHGYDIGLAHGIEWLAEEWRVDRMASSWPSYAELQRRRGEAPPSPERSL